MQELVLVGQLDSPFVRRVAITMTLYGQPFVLNPLSVYGDFEALCRIHPMGTVPALVDESGQVHSETEAICAWLDSRAPTPLQQPSLAALQAMGWAHTLASKAGELYRMHQGLHGTSPPPEGVARIRIQFNAGLRLLTHWLVANKPIEPQPGHAQIAIVCGLRFVQMVTAATGLTLAPPKDLEAALTRHEQHAVFAQCATP
jgi:glutathione S-transferase